MTKMDGLDLGGEDVNVENPKALQGRIVNLQNHRESYVPKIPSFWHDVPFTRKFRARYLSTYLVSGKREESERM